MAQSFSSLNPMLWAGGLAVALVLTSFGGWETGVRAEDRPVGVETGLPLPRFVSLKANKVNVRVGPSRTHPVRWVYQRKGLPIEILAEFENWRRVRDMDGDVGWIYHTLLDGRRHGLVRPSSGEETATLFSGPGGTGETIAAAESNVVVALEACGTDWCLAQAGGYAGWIAKQDLWGVYAVERFE
ncbi:SH3 domain-containing protein [Parvibaculaceae bacterium PLY_AMNH_Bact1]|nr:SH3 domain-containing protein [Parvibaculaceae bacterium PLY_AMNH_Bact1]